MREGITSTGKLLMGGKHQVYTLNSESTLAHGALGFNSRKGLYNRLQAENSEDDYQQLDFVYGVFPPADDLKLTVSIVGSAVSDVGLAQYLEKFEMMAKKFVQPQLSVCDPCPMAGLICDCKLC